LPANQIAAAPDSPHHGGRSSFKWRFLMAVWHFDLEPIPAALAIIEGVPAIHLHPRSGITSPMR